MFRILLLGESKASSTTNVVYACLI